MSNQKPKNIQSAEDNLTYAIDEAVNEFAKEQALDGIGKYLYSPASLDEALERDSYIADNDDIYDKLESLVRAVISEKYEEYLRNNQEEWSSEQALERTYESMRGSI